MAESLDSKLRKVVSEDINTLSRRYDEANALAEEYHAFVMSLAGGDQTAFEQHTHWFSTVSKNLEIARAMLRNPQPERLESIRYLLHALVQNISFLKTQLGRIALRNDLTNVQPLPWVSQDDVERRNTEEPDNYDI